MSTIRHPVTSAPSGRGDDAPTIIGHVEIDPAQILGDVPARLEALRKAFLSVPHPATAEVLRIMEADAPQQDAKPAPAGEMAEPIKGDYVLATKYEDGEAWDWWGLGFLDRIENGRFMVVDNDGKQTRGNGYRRCRKISKDCGHWLWNQRAELERVGAKLWDMVASFNNKTQPTDAAKPDADEAPHPMLCFQHGGSPVGEEENKRNGMTCPRCKPGADKQRVQIPSVIDPDNSGNLRVEYPKPDAAKTPARVRDDGNRRNNTPSNLRYVPMTVNRLNSSASGVSQKKCGTWEARITHRGADLYLGTFPDEASASKTRDAIKDAIINAECSASEVLQRALAELADLRQRYDALHDQRHEEARKVDQALAELAAERSCSASKRLADLMKTYQEVCQQCTGLSADLANERAFRQEDRQTLEIVKADLAAMTQAVNGAWTVLRNGSNPKCTNLPDAINEVVCKAANDLAAMTERADRLRDEYDRLNAADTQHMAETDAARADADALAEALRGLRSTFSESGHPGRPCHRSEWVYDVLLTDIDQQLAAHDARRGG